MPVELVTVAAPSRLHFGLFSFGDSSGKTDRRNYGGVGVMIDSPELKLSISRSDELRVSGPLAARAKKVALQWADAQNGIACPNCQIEIQSVPPQHCGLGTGTQLAMSVVAGLNAWHGRSCADPREHAQLAGRGKRSAVGVYGFLSGGLIVETGKHSKESLSPLKQRHDLPAHWRFVLIRPALRSGFSGQQEKVAFATVPAVEVATTQHLHEEMQRHMLPALKDNDFDRFSQSIYRFGHAAGMCFAALQGGPYNGPVLNKIVQTARRLGVKGVGQSSWGPTIYCLLPSATEAQSFIEKMRIELSSISVEFRVGKPNNTGAKIEQQDPPQPAGRSATGY